MTRNIALLATVIAVELVIGWFVLSPSQSPFLLPEPNLKGFPEATRRGVEKARNSTRPHIAADLDHLADVFFASGFYAESEACYRQAATLKPLSPQYHYNLGFCLASIGDLAGSDAAFHAAIKAGHSRADACWYFIGMNALRANRAGQAREAFRSSGSIAAARIELAQLLLADGKLDESKSLLTKLLAEHPNSKRCYQLLAEIADRNGDDVSSQEGKALADVLYQPIQGPWHARAGKMQEIYLSLGVSQQVSRLTDQPLSKASLSSGAAQIEADNKVLWDPTLEDYLSDLAGSSQETDKQIMHLRAIIDRDGLNSYRAARLGFALLQQQKKEEAKRLFELGIHLPVARANNGVVDMSRALATLESDEIKSGQYLAFAEFQSGLQLMDELDVASAQKSFQRATAEDSKSARYWFWLGRSSLLLGQTEVAREGFAKCLQLNPNHERAQKFAATIASD